MVDLACGWGRHALHLANLGIPTIGFDRNPDRLRELVRHAADTNAAVQPVRCDLESSLGIPLADSCCGAILVFRFLHRPLARAIEAALGPGGILLYETFTLAHCETGRGPRREAFYLAPGELPGLFSGLEVIAYEEGPDGGDPGSVTARLAARKPR
ncbi:MAG: class I SAM-dependent methyltransferase [bacterium]|nr:class I SAM-dependent methyltransferase [bacterium]